MLAIDGAHDGALFFNDNVWLVTGVVQDPLYIFYSSQNSMLTVPWAIENSKLTSLYIKFIIIIYLI